jgi:hypothetical protein
MTKYKRTKIVSTKGFGATSDRELREAAEKRGRVILAVKPESARDPRPIDFAYTIPKPGIKEPVLLASYPSQKTLQYLLNVVGDRLRETGWDDLDTVDFTDLEGFLGETGEIPVGARLLSAEEHARASKTLTCQADPETPVVLLSIPDPYGIRPQSPVCHPDVSRSDLYLYVRITEDDLDPESLWDAMKTVQRDQLREALIEHADTVENILSFRYWWETLCELDESSAVALMNSNPKLTELYKEYARENGLIEDGDDNEHN